MPEPFGCRGGTTMAALPPAVLAHARPSALAAVLGGALTSSPRRDERSREGCQSRWLSRLGTPSPRWPLRASLTGVGACSLRCSRPPCADAPIRDERSRETCQSRLAVAAERRWLPCRLPSSAVGGGGLPRDAPVTRFGAERARPVSRFDESRPWASAADWNAMHRCITSHDAIGNPGQAPDDRYQTAGSPALRGSVAAAREPSSAAGPPSTSSIAWAWPSSPLNGIVRVTGWPRASSSSRIAAG